LILFYCTIAFVESQLNCPRFGALSEWNPTQQEKDSTGQQDSKELRAYQKAFIKARREAQFLFDDESGIHKLLEQIHHNAMGVIGYTRDLAPKIGGCRDDRD
jgi:hypothetical protein